MNKTLDELLDLAENGDPADLLKLVNRAIAEICLHSQSYAIGSHKLTRADLKSLYTFRKMLQGDVAASKGHAFTVAVFRGR